MCAPSGASGSASPPPGSAGGEGPRPGADAAEGGLAGLRRRSGAGFPRISASRPLSRRGPRGPLRYGLRPGRGRRCRHRRRGDAPRRRRARVSATPRRTDPGPPLRPGRCGIRLPPPRAARGGRRLERHAGSGRFAQQEGGEFVGTAGRPVPHRLGKRHRVFHAPVADPAEGAVGADGVPEDAEPAPPPGRRADRSSDRSPRPHARAPRCGGPDPRGRAGCPPDSSGRRRGRWRTPVGCGPGCRSVGSGPRPLPHPG